MATPDRQSYTVVRSNVSLPCEIRVLPGTPIADAPVAQRTERCSIAAYWFIGRLPTCDIHLRAVCQYVGWNYTEIVQGVLQSNPELPREIPNAEERKPWEQQYRYPQGSSGAAA